MGVRCTATFPHFGNILAQVLVGVSDFRHEEMVRKSSAAGDEWLAKKIFFGIRKCTYKFRKRKERMELDDFWKVKEGLTRCDTWRPVGLPSLDFRFPVVSTKKPGRTWGTRRRKAHGAGSIVAHVSKSDETWGTLSFECADKKSSRPVLCGEVGHPPPEDVNGKSCRLPRRTWTRFLTCL